MVVSVLILLIPAFFSWHSNRTRYAWTGFFIQTRIGLSHHAFSMIEFHGMSDGKRMDKAVGQDRSKTLESSFTQARIDPVGGIAEIQCSFFPVVSQAGY
jgi:hypothetical protein